jgi:hypothetical protein
MTLGARDTSNCPVGFRCESCGSSTDDLLVVTHGVLNAIMCVTMCGSCRDSRRPPSIMLTTAEKLVEQHRDHVGGVTPVYRVEASSRVDPP